MSLANRAALLVAALAMFALQADAKNAQRVRHRQYPTVAGITAFFTTAQTSDLAGVGTDTGGKTWGTYHTFTVNAAHRVGCQNGSPALSNLAYIDVGAVNPTVRMTYEEAPTGGTDFGFLVRGFNNGNQYIVYWSGVDRYAVVRTDSDVPVGVALSGASQSISLGDVFKVRSTSTDITIYQNDNAKLSYTASTYNGGTYVGWYVGIFNGGDAAGTGRFDHFTVTFE